MEAGYQVKSKEARRAAASRLLKRLECELDQRMARAGLAMPQLVVSISETIKPNRADRYEIEDGCYLIKGKTIGRGMRRAERQMVFSFRSGGRHQPEQSQETPQERRSQPSI